jgi:hypothetical protein
MPRLRAVLIVNLLAAALTARGLAGQGGVSVQGIRGLIFGTVLPGVPTHVLRTDPVNSGQFEVRGPPPKTVVLTFTLPVVLNGPVGATMPLSFATNDGGYSATNSILSQVAFDPHVPYATALGNNRVGVFLGGTVSPTPTQRAGSYTAVVILSVVVL